MQTLQSISFTPIGAVILCPYIIKSIGHELHSTFALESWVPIPTSKQSDGRVCVSTIDYFKTEPFLCEIITLLVIVSVSLKGVILHWKKGTHRPDMCSGCCFRMVLA